MNATENMELSAEERKIILLIRSMERGELQIIMRNNRPVRAEQILRYPEEDDVYETDGRTEILSTPLYAPKGRHINSKKQNRKEKKTCKQV